MPGPDELAPGWGSNFLTPMGEIQQLSMMTSNIGRPQRGWRGRMGRLFVLVALVVIAGPIAIGMLLEWLGLVH